MKSTAKLPRSFFPVPGLIRRAVPALALCMTSVFFASPLAAEHAPETPPEIANDSSTLWQPEIVEPSRYESLFKKSPFVMATTEAASTTYALGGYFKIGDSYSATLIRKDNKVRILISQDDPPGGEFQLISIKENDDMKLVEAVVRVGSTPLFIKYDPTLLAQPNDPAQAQQLKQAQATAQKKPAPPSQPPQGPTTQAQQQPPVVRRRAIIVEPKK